MITRWHYICWGCGLIAIFLVVGFLIEPNEDSDWKVFALLSLVGSGIGSISTNVAKLINARRERTSRQ